MSWRPYEPCLENERATAKRRAQERHVVLGIDPGFAESTVLAYYSIAPLKFIKLIPMPPRAFRGQSAWEAFCDQALGRHYRQNHDFGDEDRG